MEDEPFEELRQSVREGGAAVIQHARTEPKTRFATILIKDKYDTQTAQELLRHKDLRTTMVYMHVLNRSSGSGARRPADVP